MATSQADRVFNELIDFGPCTAKHLAFSLDMPEASVRRAIGQIRADGFKVDLIDGGRLGGKVYRFKA